MLVEHPSSFSWLDINVIRDLLKNPIEATSFFVGPVFFLGSALFVFGCSAQEHDDYWEGLWPRTLNDDLVNIPFLVRLPQQLALGRNTVVTVESLTQECPEKSLPKAESRQEYQEGDVTASTILRARGP
jgi:hypothetical protein